MFTDRPISTAKGPSVPDCPRNQEKSALGSTLREKCPNTEFFLVHIFLYSE